MKDEIKEILFNLEIVARKHTIEVCEDSSKIETIPANVVDELRLNNFSAQILLDYITNLQEENKEWSMIFDTFSKRPYAHKYLEEKKKELGNKKIIGLDSEMIYKDYYDYKSRNEKAIEYIDKHTIEYVDNNFKEHNIMVKFNEYSNPQELKNILGGDDNE